MNRKVFSRLLAILLIYLVVEIALNLVYAVAQPHRLPYSYVHLSPYRGKEWAKTLFKEFSRVPRQYVPFIGWDRREFHGKWINVDAEGVRATWNPPVTDGQEVQSIYFFGGSALWGTGARDEYTIPSDLSKELNAGGTRFLVSNYGETGYSFLQEIFHLILLLRDSHRPDYVLFFDGVNDVYAAYQEGKIEPRQNVSVMREKLELSPVAELGYSVHHIFDRYSMVYRTVKSVGSIWAPQERFTEAAAGYSDSELKVLSDGVVNSYTRSLQLLDSLSKEYGFQYLCLWQPAVFTEDELTEEEKGVDKRIDDRALSALFRYTHEGMLRKSLPHFSSMADVLRGRSESYYIDFCHLSEEGNRVVASRVAELFHQEFESP